MTRGSLIIWGSVILAIAIWSPFDTFNPVVATFDRHATFPRPSGVIDMTDEIAPYVHVGMAGAHVDSILFSAGFRREGGADHGTEYDASYVRTSRWWAVLGGDRYRVLVHVVGGKVTSVFADTILQSL